MPTLYDVAHFVAWNGYAQDMLPYLGVDKESMTNQEFHFPHVVNFRYGPSKKTRIQRICEQMIPTYDPKNYYKYAIAKGYNPIKRIQELITLGAKPLPDYNGWSALLECCRNAWQNHKEIAEILIDAGADVNQESNGWTPLYLASYNNNIPIVRLLLAKGADVNKGKSRTPLAGACKMGNLEIVKLLIARGAVVSDKMYEEAIYGGHTHIIKYLAPIHPVPADSIAYALKCNVSTIPILAKLGADVNYVEDGETLVEKYSSDDSELKALLKAGADPNRTGTRGAAPPIFSAVYMNNVESVRALVDAKCDVNIVNPEDDNLKTPIHLAITLYSLGEHKKEYLEIIKILVKRSDLSWKEDSGDTPIEEAQYRKLDELVIIMKRELLRRKKALK